jgi:hypothetical protein
MTTKTKKSTKSNKSESPKEFSQDDQLRMQHFIAASNFHQAKFSEVINMMQHTCFQEAGAKLQEMSDSEKFKLLAEIAEAEEKMKQDMEQRSQEQQTATES